MDEVTRRRVLMGAVAAGAGASGLSIAARWAERYGLVPPDSGGLYGPGHTLTYGAQRLFGGQSLAREFSREQITKVPFAKGKPPDLEEFRALERGGFADWRLTVDGLVRRPGSYGVAQLRELPRVSQITHMACEEGWAYIAEWVGVRLSHVLALAEPRPEAKFVLYYSMQRGRVDSVDLEEAMHPQTLVAYGMNGKDLTVGHGGPLRMRVARQLGYKNVKFVNRVTVTDSLEGKLRKSSYSWFGGI